MTEYIERAAAMEYIFGLTIADPAAAQYADAVYYNLQSIHAADVVEVRHSNWYDCGSLSCRCSKCGCKNNRETAYCPNCGARMDIVGEESIC